jgi:SAM-dependent methyltransferase
VESFRFSGARQEHLMRRVEKGERALNIGVGAGELERIGLRKGVEMWSLDPSQRAIERLRESLGMGERAQAGYSQAIPYPDAHFDVVIMSEVLEHLDDATLDATLKDVRRVLKPGGRFIGTVPARERLSDAHVVCPACAHQFHRWGHVQSFDEADLARLLKREFAEASVKETFIIEWESVGWGRRIQELVKKFLSWRRIGPYAVARNLVFVAR